VNLLSSSYKDLLRSSSFIAWCSDELYDVWLLNIIYGYQDLNLSLYWLCMDCMINWASVVLFVLAKLIKICELMEGIQYFLTVCRQERCKAFLTVRGTVRKDWTFADGLSRPTWKVSVFPNGWARRRRFEYCLTVWQPSGKVSLTAMDKPSWKLFRDGHHHQGLIPDGFPSGKIGFPWQSVRQGKSSVTVFTTFPDGLGCHRKNLLG
jgi:hypothetical protein